MKQTSKQTDKSFYSSEILTILMEDYRTDTNIEVVRFLYIWTQKYGQQNQKWTNKPLQIKMFLHKKAIYQETRIQLTVWNTQILEDHMQQHSITNYPWDIGEEVTWWKRSCIECDRPWIHPHHWQLSVAKKKKSKRPEKEYVACVCVCMYYICMCVCISSNTFYAFVYYTHTRERRIRDFKTLKLKSQCDIILLLCLEDW